MSYKFLGLADLEDCSEEEVREHLIQAYGYTDGGLSVTEGGKKRLKEELLPYDILIGYESVGDYGCDSASWFLLRHKETGEYCTISGSHCSCYGFEGQGDLENTDLLYLNSPHFDMYGGGYDEDWKKNFQAIKGYIKTLVQPLSLNDFI